MKFNSLTHEEKRVIERKGTEAPFSGEYENYNQTGIYLCKRCGAYLYRSEDKFDAHCGWPSFDHAILGAVESRPDDDGQRTEILCARCRGHLGHVFLNEKLTPKNTRHCVNSLSMKFIPKKELAGESLAAYFGGGCFWCVEASFKLIRGVLSVTSGYAGGKHCEGGKAPAYEAVSSGDTGQVEAVMVKYDPVRIAYEALLEVFFAVHDPTALNRQGNDIGRQYRSIILYKAYWQREIAEEFIKKLAKFGIYNSPIVTEIKPLEKFYRAESYHQDYFTKNPQAAYCQAVINQKILNLKKKMYHYLKLKYQKF